MKPFFVASVLAAFLNAPAALLFVCNLQAGERNWRRLLLLMYFIWSIDYLDLCNDETVYGQRN